MKTCIVAIFGLVLFAGAGVAWADPTLSLGLRLQDTNNQDLPNVNGHYELAPGQEFRVVVSGTIGNPYWTDAYHKDKTGQPLAPIPLGLAYLISDLQSSGTPGMLSPLAGPPLAPGPTAPPTWNLTATDLAETLAKPNDINAPWINLGKLGPNGDLGPNGFGFVNLSVTSSGWGPVTSADYLAGLQNGLGSQTDIIRGGYVVNRHGTGTLTLSGIFAASIFDPSAQDNILRAESISPSNITTAWITITAPEPASAALIVVVAGAMLARRRDRGV